MLIETTDRTEEGLREMLALVSEPDGSVEEHRHVLARAKALHSLVTALEAKSARFVAEREGHGDGGAQMLADAAGLSRRDAKSQVDTDRILDAMPAARAAVDAGKVPMANARALAGAVGRVGLGEVASDAELLEKAATESPEKFNRNLRRWAVQTEGDDGTKEQVRQRNDRGVKFFTSDDGMTQMRGQFDAVTGQRIQNRFQAWAKRLWADAKNTPGSDCRKFDHAMADVLDALTAGHSPTCTGACGGTGGGASTTDDATRAGADPHSPNRSRSATKTSTHSGDTPTEEGSRCRRGPGLGHPFADIAVVATVSDDGERLVGEIAGGDPLPPAVLAELMCNARLTGVLFNKAGTAIWQGHSARVATEAQKRQLIRTYGGCFHCGAHPTMCQAHHITPYADGGQTNLDNLILVCWNCHQHIHHHNWQIHQTPTGGYTLHPPGHQPPDRAEPAGALAAGIPEPAQLQLE